MQYHVEEISLILVCQQSKFTLKHTLDPLYVGHAMTRDEDYFKVLQVFFVFIHMKVHFKSVGFKWS